MRALLIALAAACPVSAVAQGSPSGCAAPARESAESLVAQGRYWHALRAAPPAASPDLSGADLLVQLRVAEGLGQTARVGSLLRRAGGLDTIPEILAVAARQDERDRNWPAAAAKYRRLETLSGASPVERATALTRLALVLGHVGPAAAAEAWRRAAAALPAVADWFEFNLALEQADTAGAVAALAAATTPGERLAAESLVARRREESGDLAGALAVYLRRGWALQAMRVELELGRTAAVRERADSMLLRDPARPDAFEAARLLAARFRRLQPSEVLGIARAYAARGRLAAAERWLQRVATARDTSLARPLELAAIRSRAGRFRAALAALDDAVRLRRQRGAAEPARVTRARVEILGAAGRWQEAAALATRAAQASPGDSDVAAALLLVSDHQRALADAAAERALYGTLLERFAGSRAAVVARFRLALADYASGRRDAAESGLAVAPPEASAGGLSRAWRYWAARLRLDRRDPAAPGALRALAAEGATDYYGVRAQELLGDSLPLAPDAPPPATAFPASRARERIVILARVGLEDEARAEARGWLGAPGASAQVLVEAADGAATARLGPEAMLLADAARRRVGLTGDVARALFPMPYRGVIVAEAAEECVDPLLLAAVIRQESRFQVHARSRAGARGLIQVLPRTGAEMSRLLRLGPWSAQLLDAPDFNLHLGARYLRDRQTRDSLPLYALIASYIAGRTGVRRWLSRPEFRDVDLFIERLPSAGIADYVRNVYANYAWYRRLYPSTGTMLR